MKFLINIFVNLYAKTIGSWSLPYVNKKFPIRDYFKIEKMLRNLDSPLAIALVTTYGNGSNVGIRVGQWIGPKKWTKKTHVAIQFEIKDGYKHRVAEAVGGEPMNNGGLIETTLLEAIGQRDEVKILVPDFDSPLNQRIASFVCDFVADKVREDKINPIPYDDGHSILTPELNCSELLYKALRYAFNRADAHNPMEPVIRGGIPTWTPADVEYSDFFRVVYDSERIKK